MTACNGCSIYFHDLADDTCHKCKELTGKSEPEKVSIHSGLPRVQKKSLQKACAASALKKAAPGISKGAMLVQEMQEKREQGKSNQIPHVRPVKNIHEETPVYQALDHITLRVQEFHAKAFPMAAKIRHLRPSKLVVKENDLVITFPRQYFVFTCLPLSLVSIRGLGFCDAIRHAVHREAVFQEDKRPQELYSPNGFCSPRLPTSLSSSEYLAQTCTYLFEVRQNARVPLQALRYNSAGSK
ncbi:hypothetical protein DFH09DRAFT_1093369 [Mycena vulgaris]|nr:hypothetical protein DFH09DRAFT_1093369 [Mycena vulgaris]